MLPRPLYESIPYLCIFIASLIPALLTGPLYIFSALLLFVAGSHVWILRSKHRRPDRVRVLLDPDSLIPYYRRLVLPKGLYEVLPFVYLAAGWGILVSIDSIVGQFSGGLLALTGGLIWRLRHLHRIRREPKTKFAHLISVALY